MDEAEYAQLVADLIALQSPTQLLKVGQLGKPKFRAFRLSENLKELIWTSKKDSSRTRIELQNVTSIKLGQRTDKFMKNRNPDLEHVSFSLVYNYGTEQGQITQDTLDLIAKESTEFELWTRILIALIDETISPEILERARKDVKSQIKKTGREDSIDFGMDKRNKKALKSLVLDHNQVYIVGWGEWGQTGLKHLDNVDTPVLVDSLHNSAAEVLAMGWAHMVVSVADGSVYVTGNRIGTGLTHDVSAPEKLEVKTDSAVTSIACGNFHTAIVTDNGDLYTLGCGMNGQLGADLDADILTPSPVEFFRDCKVYIIGVACGSTFTAALSNTGDIWTFGDNSRGQLGLGDRTDRMLPCLVEELEGMNVQQIACGDSFMVAITENLPYSWGCNASGQLGVGDMVDEVIPQSINTLRGADISHVSCGHSHCGVVVTVSVSDLQVVYMWGSNRVGQCGMSMSENLLVPSAIRGLGNKNIIQIECGAFHTVALSEGGELFSCGLGTHGQLALGGMKNSVKNFEEITGLDGKKVRRIVCGDYNTAFLVARTWVKDTETFNCMTCIDKFTLLNRRHHCRNCGGIFCGACSSKKAVILKFGFTKPVRVCDDCHSKLKR